MSEEPKRRRGRRRCCGAVLAAFALLVVLNWTWGRLPDAPPPPAGSKFAIVDGTRIHYVETPGREPAVVMVHGLPGTWGDWNRVASAAKGRRSIQIDRPGYAYSAAGYLPSAQQVELLHRFTEQLELRDPVIAGHSYGGSIALQYGARYPRDVSGIVAVDPAVTPSGLSAMRAAQARIVQFSALPVVEPVMNATVSDLFRSVSARMGGNEAYSPAPRDPAWLERTLSLNMRQRDLDAWADETLGAQTALTSVQNGLPSTRAKVWFIQGKDDELIDAADVQAAAARVPGAQLQLLPGGHMQTDEHPMAIARAIEAAAKGGR